MDSDAVVTVFSNRREGKRASVILVAGATGGVGKRVAVKLLEKGRHVRALVRDVDKAKAMLGSGAHSKVPGAVLDLVAADITQPATLRPEMFAGVSGVVCATAAKVAPKEGDTEDRSKYYQGIKFYDPEIVGDTPESVDFKGVKHLVDALGEQLGKQDGSVLMGGSGQGGSTRADLQWGALDDVVMGGVSSSSMQSEGLVDGTPAALFAGTVRTENNGGFASMRTKNMSPPLNLGAYDGLRMRVKGNGQRFKFLIRTDAGFDTVAYSISFDTAPDVWQTIDLPFSEFTPVFRARTLEANESQPLDASSIVSLQIMLSKFEYNGDLNPNFKPGPFQLPIQHVEAYTLSPKFIYVSSAGVTRPNRPGIDVDVEPPAVKLNDALGGILTYKLKGEDYIRSSGLPYCIVRPCALTEEPEGAELMVDQGDNMKGKISREDVAELCLSVMGISECLNTTFEIKSTVPFSEPFVQGDDYQQRDMDDWRRLLAQVKPGVTGKTIDGVYTGSNPEPVLEESKLSQA